MIKRILITTLLLILLVSSVSALTESGNFTSESYAQYEANLYTATEYSAVTISAPFNVTVYEISAINGLDAILISHDISGARLYANYNYAEVPFTSDYGTGKIGYQISYNLLGQWQSDYLYIIFDAPIQTSHTGWKSFRLNYDNTALGNPYITGPEGRQMLFTSSTGSYMATIDTSNTPSLGNTKGLVEDDAAGQVKQRVYNNIRQKFKHSYTVDLDENNIVKGEVIKNIGEINYVSKIFVTDYTNAIVASESALTSNTFNFNSFTSPLKINALDAYGIWHNSSFLLSPSVEYNISLSPSFQNVNDNISVTLSSNEIGVQLDNLVYVQQEMYLEGYNNDNKFFAIDNLGNYANYLKNSSGYWGRYTDVGYVFGSSKSFPNNIAISFPASGNWTIYTTIEDVSGTQLELVNYYIVSGSVGKYKLAIYPIDGYDGSFISGSQINLFDDQTKIWTNRTVTEISQCAFPVSTGFYKFEVYAPDDSYTDVNQGNLEGVFIVNEDVQTTVTLYPKQTGDNPPIEGDITNSTVFIGVKEPTELKPVYGATITIKPSGQIAKTNSVGIASFNLINGTAYQAVATAQGYAGTTVGFTPNAAVYSFDIALGSNANVPDDYGGYVTPIPSPTVTPVPVITPDKWDNSKATTCQLTMPANSTPIQRVMNSMACAGIEDAQGQSLAIAALIIMVFVAAGAKYGKGIGAAVGSVIGFVLSLAAGLIPTWVFFALLCMLALVVMIYALNR